MLITNFISIYLLSVTIVVIFYAVQIRTLSGANYAKTAMLLCLAVCFYILGYTLELNSTGPAQILFWNLIEYIGIPFVSALWLTMALIYTGHLTRYKKLVFAAIYIIPFITLILRYTNEYHHLYFSSLNFVKELGTLILVKQAGPWMYVQAAHSAAMVFAALGLFIYDAAKKKERQNGKIYYLISATVFAIMGLVLAQFKLLPFRIDYMALFLPTTCIMVILAITRYDLLEIKSLARSKVFEAGNDAILLLNSQNRILDYNDSANRLFQRIGINPEDKCLSAAFAERPELLKSMESPITSVIKLPIGDKNCYYEITTESTDDKNALRGWIKTIRDVTEIYLLNEELHRLAMTDELSVLSNRRAFIKLGKEWVLKSEENSGILYLLMLDLDHFKDVNDQYGHLSGDLAIREFAQLLKNHFNSNSLVARLGGEEFAVLLESQTDDEVVALVRSFLSRAERHIYNYSGVRFNVTVSIGVTKKQPGQTLESMMQKADRALYQSKEHGRNRFTVL